MERAEAAERRIREEELRGIKNPEKAKLNQKLLKQKKNPEPEKMSNEKPNLTVSLIYDN